MATAQELVDDAEKLVATAATAATKIVEQAAQLASDQAVIADLQAQLSAAFAASIPQETIDRTAADVTTAEASLAAAVTPPVV